MLVTLINKLMQQLIVFGNNRQGNCMLNVLCKLIICSTIIEAQLANSRELALVAN